MAAIEEDIFSTPDILRRTYGRVAGRKDTLGVPFGGPIALLGCGSSYCVALAAAAAYERERLAAAQAIVASDYLPRPGWTHVAISRTGRTTSLLRFDHVVFLGRGPSYGLARAAAVNLQETALLVPEAHQTLDYRHGPIAAADADTLVWSLDAPGDAENEAVLDDVRRAGATVYAPSDDPLIALAQAQLTALHQAQARGVDPATPRHLARAVIF